MQGQTISVSVKQSTPHWGRFELRLCPLSDPSLATEYNELSEACLDAHQLKLAPNSTQVRVLGLGLGVGVGPVGARGPQGRLNSVQSGLDLALATAEAPAGAEKAVALEP